MGRTRIRLRQALLPCAAVFAIVALSGIANAQVTSAQQSAMRSNCRSDFTSHCSGVSPGGKDALTCLQKNVGSLSPACKKVVSETLPPPPAPAAEAAPAPAPAAPKEAAAPAAATAAPAQPATATTTPAVSAPPIRAKVDPAPQRPAAATTAKPAPAAAPATATVAPVTAPPPAAAAPAPHRPNAPIVMTAVIGRSCLRDLVRHCRDAGLGDGEKIACLTAHADSLTVMCRAAMKITTPLR